MIYGDVVPYYFFGLVCYLYFVLIPVATYYITDYADKNAMPICSCRDMRKAHDNAKSQIPLEFKVDDADPFKTTPFIVRNWLSICNGYYLVWIFGSLILLTLDFTNVIDLTILSAALAIKKSVLIIFLILFIFYPGLMWLVKRRYRLFGYDCAVLAKDMEPYNDNVSI